MWWADGRKLKEITLHSIYSSLLAWLISLFLKDIFHTPRPFRVDGTIPLTAIVTHDYAFPSGHTAASFALSLTIFLHHRRLGSLFLVCSLIVGISRIAAHVHYPIDILGGGILGCIIAISVHKLHPFLLVRKLITPR